MAVRFDDMWKTAGVLPLTKFGRNTSVGTTPQDLWRVGGTWVAPATPEVVRVTSTSVNDTAAGTGARTVLINGLDKNYELTSETLTMNGATFAQSTKKYHMVHRVIVQTAGSLGANEGTISVTSTATGSPAMARMVPLEGQSQFGLFQIPAGKTGYMLSYHASFSGLTALSAVDVQIVAKPFGGVFSTKSNLSLCLNGSSVGHRTYEAPLVFTEKTIVKMTAIANTASNDVSGSFDLMIVDN